MSPYLPPLLVAFFGVFHFLGGGAAGQGVRAALRGSDDWKLFLLWGLGMGGLPVVFDWFFLIAQGYALLGLIGPAIFVVTLLASAFLEMKIDPTAVISAALGSAALMIGLFAIPLMLDAYKESNPGVEDYIFSAIFVLLFVLIGGAFAWNGFSAILRGVSLDHVLSERVQKQNQPRKRKGG